MDVMADRRGATGGHEDGWRLIWSDEFDRPEVDDVRVYRRGGLAAPGR